MKQKDEEKFYIITTVFESLGKVRNYFGKIHKVLSELMFYP